MCTQNLTQGLVNQVGCGVVGLAGVTLVSIHAGHHGSLGVLGQLLGNVHRQTVLLLGVNYIDCLEFAYNHALVTYLAAHLCIERGLVQDNLVDYTALLLYLAVAQDGCLVFSEIITYKLGLTLTEHYPVTVLYGGGITGAGLLLAHLLIELVNVGAHAVLTQYEFGKVKRESVGIVQGECAYSAYLCLAGSLGIGHNLVKQFDTGVKGAQERLLLLNDYLLYECLLGVQLGISVTHVVNEHGQQLVEECLLLAQERVGVTYCTAQYAANHVTGLGIGWQLAVGNRECNGADVVGNYAHGYVNLLILSVLKAGQSTYLLDYGLEHVGVIVGLLALQGAYQTLKSHTGIDYLGGQGFQ